MQGKTQEGDIKEGKVIEGSYKIERRKNCWNMNSSPFQEL
jgi:hypothetical protein